VGPAAADAERVGEEGVEGGRFDDGVDFAAAEADAGWVLGERVGMSALLDGKVWGTVLHN
jgi:hypothetical protein